MTLSTSRTKVSYVPDGVQTRFAIPFPVFGEESVFCRMEDATGAEEELTNYAVKGLDSLSGAYVHFYTPPPVGKKLVIYRYTRRVQESDYPEGGKFPATVVEIDFDRVVAMIQELQEELERAIKVPITSDMTPEEMLKELCIIMQVIQQYYELIRNAVDGLDGVSPRAYNPINLLADAHPNRCELLYINERRGGDVSPRALVQSVAYDGVNNNLYFYHLGADVPGLEHLGARYGIVSRYNAGVQGAIRGLDAQGADARTGHQGLAVENLEDGGIKLWTSNQYGSPGGVVLRFDYTPDGIPGKVEEYVISDHTGNGSATPAISYDQRYLLVARPGIGADGRSAPHIRVFDLKTLRKGGPGNYSRLHLTEFQVQVKLVTGETSFQAMACDGAYVYVLGSGSSIDTPAAIYCYNMAGELVSKNQNITVGMDIAAQLGSGTFYEPEALFFMPVDGKPALCLGVGADDGGSRELVIYGIGTRNGLLVNRFAPGGHIPDAADLSEFTESGIYYKNSSNEVVGWPNIGTNGFLVNMGMDEESGRTIQHAYRMGAPGSNNYMTAFRTIGKEADGLKTDRWWHNAVLFARAYRTAEGEMSGWAVNISSMVRDAKGEFTFVLEGSLPLSSVALVLPQTANAGAGGVATVLGDRIKVVITDGGQPGDFAFGLAVL